MDLRRSKTTQKQLEGLVFFHLGFIQTRVILKIASFLLEFHKCSFCYGTQKLQRDITLPFSRTYFYASTASGSFTGLVATILHTGMVSFLLNSFNDGWNTTSCNNTFSSMSSLLTSISILDGICSAGPSSFRVLRIDRRFPPGHSNRQWEWKI